MHPCLQSFGGAHVRLPRWTVDVAGPNAEAHSKHNTDSGRRAMPINLHKAGVESGRRTEDSAPNSSPSLRWFPCTGSEVSEAQ